MTYKTQQRLSRQLADIIKVDAEIISRAIDEITRIEVARVARNNIENKVDTNTR